MPFRVRRPGRWLLVLTPLVVTVALAVLAFPRWRANALRDELKSREVDVWTEPGGPQWLGASWKGRWFEDVVAVGFGGLRYTLSRDELKSFLPRLRHFPRLKAVSFARLPHDLDLAFLHQLPQLEHFSCNTPQIDDEDLRAVGACRRLRTLDLNSTGVSDAGLRHLEGLTDLRALILDGTQVGDEGMGWIAEHLPSLELLSVSNTEVTDQGLQPLIDRFPELAVTDD